jgi:lipid II:glycine glycyltransferase (peptidoglycan interpeptide bridge formation enzyme)
MMYKDRSDADYLNLIGTHVDVTDLCRMQRSLDEARQRAEELAAMLMLCHGLTATYHIGWSGPQGRATAAHQLLLVRAADWLAARGHVRLDLGTVDTDANPGLARFKIGSGAIIRPLGGSWVGVPGLKAAR